MSTRIAGVGAISYSPAIEGPSGVGSAVVPNGRLHHVDGWRAVAALLVMLHHFATGSLSGWIIAWGWSRLGTLLSYTTNSGVELFFVLSGVVLLRPYLRGARPFRWGRYARRRVERLWPPYLVAMVFAGAVVLYDTWSPTWYDTLPTFAFDDWIRQATVVNLGWQLYNLAWWSLTPEIAFYLAAPLIVAAIARRRDASRLIVAAGVVAAVASILLWDPKTSMTGVQDGPINVALQFVAYLPCFIAGVLLARVDPSRDASVALAGLGAAYLGVAIVFERANVHVAFALLYTGLVALSNVLPWLRAQLSRPLMIWIGERSYSLFLTHFSVLYLADALTSHVYPARTLGYYLTTRIGAACGTILLSILLFQYVERRFARNLVTATAFWPWSAAQAVREHEFAGDTRS